MKRSSSFSIIFCSILLFATFVFNPLSQIAEFVVSRDYSPEQINFFPVDGMNLLRVFYISQYLQVDFSSIQSNWSFLFFFFNDSQQIMSVVMAIFFFNIFAFGFSTSVALDALNELRRFATIRKYSLLYYLQWIIVTPLFLLSSIFVPSKDLYCYLASLIVSSFFLKKHFALARYNFKFYIFAFPIIALALLTRNQYISIILIFTIGMYIENRLARLVYTGVSITAFYFLAFNFFPDALSFESFVDRFGSDFSTYYIFNSLDNFLSVSQIFIIPVSLSRFLLNWLGGFFQLFRFFSNIRQGIWGLSGPQDFLFAFAIFMLIVKTLQLRGQKPLIQGNQISYVDFIILFKRKSSENMFFLILTFVLIIGFIPFSQFRYYWPVVPLIWCLFLMQAYGKIAYARIRR